MNNLDFKVKELEKEYLLTFYSVQKRYLDGLYKLENKYKQKETMARQSGVEYSQRKELAEEHKKILLSFRRKPKPFKEIISPETFGLIEEFGLEKFISMFWDNITI